MENIVPEVQETPEVAEVATAPAAPQKKLPKKLLMIAIPVAIAVIIIAVIVGISVNKSNQYKDALALAEDGDIIEAIAIHEKLGDYKDLKVQISDYAVEEFDDLLDDASYKKLLKLYAAVTNYPDALEEMNQELTKHVASLLKKGKFSEAEDLFNRASKEEVAVDLIAQGLVDGAKGWLEDNSFYDVLEVYELLEKHEASRKALEDAIGNRFAKLMEEEDYAAESLFYILRDRDIHVEGVYAAIYDHACALMDQGEYYAALDGFEILGEYQDAAQKILDCQYGIDKNNMVYYMENEWFYDAREILNKYEGDRYNELKELYIASATEYLQYYMESGWYSSASNFVDQHEGEIYEMLLAVYKSCCGDDSVIADLEAAVSARLELEAQGVTDYQALVDAQMEFLAKYEDLPFYDSTLGELVDDYLDYLDDQQYYINWYSSYWYLPYYMGLQDAEMIGVLTTLNESYGLGADNAEIQAILGKSESLSAYWEAWYSISNDLNWDLDYIYSDYYEGYRYLSYRNDTDYTYNLKLHLIYTDSEGVEVATQDFEYTDLTPGTENRIIVEYPDNTSYWEVQWEFTNITLNGEAIG